MIEKLKTINPYDETEINMDVNSVAGLVYENTPLVQKINELVDAVNELQATISKMKNVECSENVQPVAETRPENVQNDHYWYKQQERYKAALVLIRNLSGAGMSYQDMCIESREIAKWALDPDYKPLLIGRYSKDDQELFDTLREIKGGDNE